MMPPQTARKGGHRSGGGAPVPSPLRPTFLSGEARPALGVEGGDSPPSVRPTPLGLAVVGVLAALGFCLALWACLWLLGHGLFIAAFAGLCAFLVVFGLVERRRNKNLNK